ncbi:MAG: FHA domain-containing protein [Polyangiaceae bacterium]
MDCGNRLKPAQRVVEPTPPRGVQALGGTAFMDQSPLAQAPAAPPAAAPERPPSVRPRPAAPDFEFAPKAPAGEGNTCSRCGTLNPEVNRFCLSCGAQLHHSKPALASPVVDFSAPVAPAPQHITCNRCKGSNQPNMRFCQYCGAALSGNDATRPDSPEARQAAAAAFEQIHAHHAARASAPAAAPTPAPAAPPAPAYSAPAPQPVAAAAPPVPQPIAGPHPVPVPDPIPAPRPVPSPQPQLAPQPASAAPPQEQSKGQARGKLVVIAQDGSPGREYPIFEDQVDIGRQEGAIVLPNDPYVSPRHARVMFRDGHFFIRDLGSVNGVYVRLTKTEPLRNADLILVGLEVLRFEIVSEAEKGLGQAAERGTQIFGSPAAPRFARLSQKTVEGVTRDVYHLTREQTVIGRESGDIVFTGDPFMSRRHAGVTREPSGREFSLRDLGSSNGTYLAIRGEQQLEDGDHVRIGQHLFRLEILMGSRQHRREI